MTQPNIVLIVASDMGYGDFGVFNDGAVRTPTLDRLVDESVCLTQHYSGSPVCSPARGFDEFAGFCGGWADYYRWNLDRNGSLQPSDGRYLTDVLTDEAVAFIGRHLRKPFFLNVMYNAPHSPLQAPDEVVFAFPQHLRQLPDRRRLP